ncbi:MAG TPA: glycosyltransferase [Polyangiaceae bacterium]|nr:glycosyltransferase [Polyangiaceae bacterium]
MVTREFPAVSVVIRSYDRLDACIELIENVLSQDHPSFEVVVVEQTPNPTAAQVARLTEFERDPRVRILRSAPLGAARARNVGWRSARNEVVLFMDDDDLPLRADWIRCHAQNFRDPLCVAVTGREVRSRDEDPSPYDTARARRLCLRYTFFKMPRGHTRHTTRIEGVTAVQGGNASFRRAAIERAGGWDELTESTDENSFDFRFERVRRPGEYKVFDPTPVMLRRLDQVGGLARRQASLSRVLSFELSYSHRLIRRYYPFRFYLCYFVYLWLAASRAVSYVADHHRERSLLSLLRDLARYFAPAWRRAWA